MANLEIEQEQLDSLQDYCREIGNAANHLLDHNNHVGNGIEILAQTCAYMTAIGAAQWRIIKDIYAMNYARLELETNLDDIFGDNHG